MALTEARYVRVKVSGTSVFDVYKPPSNEYFAILVDIIVVAKGTSGAENEGQVVLQDDIGNTIAELIHFKTDQIYYNDKFIPPFPLIIMPYMKIAAWANANISPLDVYVTVIEVYNPTMKRLIEYDLADEY